MAIWCISQWQTFQCPRNLRIVELGPGTGTMASDILRSLKCFPNIFNDCNLSFHFIEISESLSQLQFKTLSCQGENKSKALSGNGDYYLHSAHQNLPLYWYKSLDHMDLQSDNYSGCTIFLAYEFFDALPIHKFVKTDKGWKEVFIDVDDDEDKLKFTVLPNITLAAQTLINVVR